MTFGDTPLEHLYTQQTSPYFRAPHIYVAIGGRFMPGRQVLTEEQAKELNVNPGYFKDCSDAYLMTSRGGNVYDRTFFAFAYSKCSLRWSFLLYVDKTEHL